MRKHNRKIITPATFYGAQAQTQTKELVVNFHSDNQATQTFVVSAQPAQQSELKQEAAESEDLVKVMSTCADEYFERLASSPIAFTQVKLAIKDSFRPKVQAILTRLEKEPLDKLTMEKLAQLYPLAWHLQEDMRGTIQQCILRRMIQLCEKPTAETCNFLADPKNLKQAPFNKKYEEDVFGNCDNLFAQFIKDFNDHKNKIERYFGELLIACIIRHPASYCTGSDFVIESWENYFIRHLKEYMREYMQKNGSQPDKKDGDSHA